MKILFLSHAPHEVHLEFAKSINSRIKIIPINWFVVLSKKISFIGYGHIFLSLLCSFFIRVKEDILLVDGGSSLFIAGFLKMRHPQIKIILLDSDLFFYQLTKKRALTKIPSFFYNKIDAMISVSEKNKKFASNHVDVPMAVSVPYPKQIKKINVKRENYGLYVGRLDPEKNIRQIVKFALGCHFFTKFIIVGDGTFSNYLKRVDSTNKKIVYVRQRKDVDRFYSQCRFLIHIPDYDPYACTVMEAALCGCLPVMSRNIGASSLFNDIFIIDDPNNFEELNKKIKYMMENELEARKLLDDAVKKFPEKEKSVRNFIDNFNKLTKELGC